MVWGIREMLGFKAESGPEFVFGTGLKGIFNLQKATTVKLQIRLSLKLNNISGIRLNLYISRLILNCLVAFRQV